MQSFLALIVILCIMGASGSRIEKVLAFGKNSEVEM